MLRRPLALALAVTALVGTAACGSGSDSAADVETTTPALDLGDALAVAQSSMPIEVPDSSVRILLEDLCTAAAGESAGVVAQIEALPLTDPAQADQVLGALDDGTDELCGGDVDPAVRSDAETAARSLVPATAATTPATTEATTGSSRTGTSGSTGSTGSSGSSGTSGSSGSSSGSSGSSGSGASNSSAGDATAGGGNANGTGNHSSTGFSQNLGGGGSSNSATTG